MGTNIINVNNVNKYLKKCEKTVMQHEKYESKRPSIETVKNMTNGTIVKNGNLKNINVKNMENANIKSAKKVKNVKTENMKNVLDGKNIQKSKICRKCKKCEKLQKYVERKLWRI